MDVMGVKPCGTGRLGLVWLLEWSPQVVSVPQFPMCTGQIIAFFLSLEFDEWKVYVSQLCYFALISPPTSQTVSGFPAHQIPQASLQGPFPLPVQCRLIPELGGGVQQTSHLGAIQNC